MSGIVLPLKQKGSMEIMFDDHTTQNSFNANAGVPSNNDLPQLPQQVKTVDTRASEEFNRINMHCTANLFFIIKTDSDHHIWSL
jgi:hypothetical protein